MFSEKLKSLRMSKNLSQQQLADAIFVSRSAICKWEMGNGLPSDVNLEAICKFFDVEEDWLLDKKDLKLFVSTNQKKNSILFKASLSGLISSFIFLLFSLFPLFSYGYCENDECAILLIAMSNRSMATFLQEIMIFPSIFYTINITYSFLLATGKLNNITIKKAMFFEILLTVICVIIFIISFICSIALAHQQNFKLGF